jgi:3D (Asp-Asp-Asp) domain-containing protein
LKLDPFHAHLVRTAEPLGACKAAVLVPRIRRSLSGQRRPGVRRTTRRSSSSSGADPDDPEPALGRSPFFSLAALAAIITAALYPQHHADSTCYAQAGTTASGEQTHLGIVAQNTLRFGTRIRLDRLVFGRRYFRVEDRIGWGSELDIFNPSEAVCIRYGRRELSYTVVGR